VFFLILIIFSYAHIKRKYTIIFYIQIFFFSFQTKYAHLCIYGYNLSKLSYSLCIRQRSVLVIKKIFFNFWADWCYKFIYVTLISLRGLDNQFDVNWSFEDQMKSSKH
jgi:hypothetical protein